VLWIPIGFDENADPAFFSMRIWIQGFDDQNYKILKLKKLNFFENNLNYFSLVLYEGRPSYSRSLDP
jgi:hypothetical protein